MSMLATPPGISGSFGRSWRVQGKRPTWEEWRALHPSTSRPAERSERPWASSAQTRALSALSGRSLRRGLGGSPACS